MSKTPYCTHCQKEGHYRYQCYSLPKKPIHRNKLGRIRTRGKQYAKWNETRRAFLQKMSDGSGYYYCHYCGKPLTIDQVTVDHKKPRGSHPHLRHEFSNLVISCYADNLKKASLSYDKYMQKLKSKA